MTYRNGTITTSGPETYYYDGEETSAVDPTSTDMRYDMPGTHCFLTEDDMESASAYLHVSTALHYTAPINIDHELDKVANYWRSQGTTDITYSTVAKGEKSITATTPLGTRMIYYVSYWNGRLMQTLRMDSLCAKEFGKGPSYIGDFNERFTTTPTPSPNQK